MHLQVGSGVPRLQPSMKPAFSPLPLGVAHGPSEPWARKLVASTVRMVAPITTAVTAQAVEPARRTTKIVMATTAATPSSWPTWYALMAAVIDDCAALLEQQCELGQLVDGGRRAGLEQGVGGEAGARDRDRADAVCRGGGDVERRVADQDRLLARMRNPVATGAGARYRHELGAQLGVRAEGALAGWEIVAEAAQRKLAARDRLEVACEQRERVPGVAELRERVGGGGGGGRTVIDLEPLVRLARGELPAHQRV